VDGNEILKHIRVEINDAKRKGLQQVTIESIEALLSVLENGQTTGRKPIEFDLALYNARATANLAEYNADRANDLELMRIVNLAGQNALKSSMLINGGAAVALLAFTSHVWPKILTKETIWGLTEALLFFVAGVVLSSVASGTTFLSGSFYQSEWFKIGDTLNYITIFLVLSAYVVFACGGYEAYLTIRTHLGG
jgi:hypothetical protein